MMIPFVFAICVSAILAAEVPGAGVAVRVPAHKDECFFEEVPAAGVKVYLHYLVTSGGSLDIDASIYGPDQELIWAAEKERESRVLFKSRLPGTHKFCFSNKMSTLTAKVVGFNIQVGDPTDSTKDHEVDPMERAIVHVAIGLNDIKTEQTYLRTRERVHRDTVESTNTRVLLWSLAEVGLIIVMGVGHVWYLRRLFETRRPV
jgi:p24 family protein beta-1